jgi:hypothetical protein
MRRMPRGAGEPAPMKRWQKLATFDSQVLQEVYRDRGATAAAVMTVAVVMFLSSLGGYLWALFEDAESTDFLIESVVVGSLAATGMFFVWAGLVALITGQLASPGTGRPDNEALRATVRTLAFATVPFGWSFLIFVPGIEYEVTLISVGLLLLSTTLATQVAAGGSLGKALGANLVGFFLWSRVLSELMGRSEQYAPAVFIWELGGF